VVDISGGGSAVGNYDDFLPNVLSFQQALKGRGRIDPSTTERRLASKRQVLLSKLLLHQTHGSIEER